MLCFDSRVDYHTQQNMLFTTKGNHFGSAYFCRNLLPTKLELRQLVKYDRPLMKYTSNKQIREWLEVDKDTAAKVIYALRKAGYIGDEYSNYMIPVNITTEVYFRLRSYNNSTK